MKIILLQDDFKNEKRNEEKLSSVSTEKKIETNSFVLVLHCFFYFSIDNCYFNNNFLLWLFYLIEHNGIGQCKTLSLNTQNLQLFPIISNYRIFLKFALI